jgi:hypothetical protein
VIAGQETEGKENSSPTPFLEEKRLILSSKNIINSQIITEKKL